MRIRRSNAKPKGPRTCRDCRKSFIGGPHAKWGLCCRWKHRGRLPKKYIVTSERDDFIRRRYDGKVKGRALEIAAALGWPRWAVQRRAAELGMTRPWSANRRDWTLEEERFIEEHAGHRVIGWIARKLKRSRTAVAMKVKHMGLRYGFREGYTMRGLMACFGTDHHAIDRWVREGKLNGRHRGTRHPHDPWLFFDADLLAFIREHPMAFRLDKVDQTWFMDLALGGGLLRERDSARGAA